LLRRRNAQPPLSRAAMVAKLETYPSRPPDSSFVPQSLTLTLGSDTIALDLNERPEAWRRAEMTIEAFVFDWKGHAARAAALARAISSSMPVTVVNSEEGVEDAHPEWVHLGDDAYFSSQWNAALDRLKADVMFHVQADVGDLDVPALCARARSLLALSRVAIYEPDIRTTHYSRYDRSRLEMIQPEIYRIPVSDCTCWLIKREVIGRSPRIDTAVNRFGWGISPTLAAVADLAGQICVRDYAVTAVHPPGRGYSTAAARCERDEYLRRLPVELRVRVEVLCGEARALSRA